jgi:succinyl-diaminopimelate desuccinylase
MVQTLLKVYQEVTGDYKTPMMTIGGGTYAKESKNTIAFGSCFPGRNDKIHSPDEEIHLVDFLSSQSIYARAIYELGNLD